MPCPSCGRPWDGTSVRCPDCGIRSNLYGSEGAVTQVTLDPVPVVVQKLETIIQLLRTLVQHVQSIDRDIRTQ